MKQQITLARITTQEAPSGATEDVVTYLHADHLGSAQTGTRSNGTVAWRQRYTPFGEAITNPAANDNLAGFTGHIKDKATGLNRQLVNQLGIVLKNNLIR